MRWIISGIVSIILGATGKFVLVGTNSPLALVVVGVVLIIIGIVLMVRARITAAEALAGGPVKRHLWWRIILVAVFGFFAATIASLLRMIKGIIWHIEQQKWQITDFLDIAVCIIVNVVLVLFVVSLVKAIRNNARLKAANNTVGKQEG